MKIKLLNSVILLIITAFMTACAQQPQNVEVQKNFWQNKKQKVDVSNLSAPQNRAHFYPEGSQGIIDVGINEAMNDGKNHLLASYDGQKMLVSAQKSFVAILNQHNIKTQTVQYVDHDELPNSKMNSNQYARKDYHTLSSQLGNNKLLTINVDMLGEVRHYYGFIPLDQPKAVCVMTGRLVDLQNNQILWRYKAMNVVPIGALADAKTNLYTAMDKAITLTSQDLANNFVKNAS